MRARLRQVRAALAPYAAALHQPYGRFGVCAADAYVPSPTSRAGRTRPGPRLDERPSRHRG